MTPAQTPIAQAPVAAPLVPLDRRALLKGGMLGVGLAAAAPLGAQAIGGGFTSGVASGEPAANSVLLWTRYVAANDTSLRWEVAESLDFARPIAGGTVTATPQRDFCCKPVATGLAPARWYYFRFIAPDGTISDVGRTKTLPQGPTDMFRMAVFSCSNIGFGWFDAYAHAAAADAFDCTFHLGDYFYEYQPGTYPSLDEAVPGRGVQPANELVALADYRARYAQYRRDPDLRRLHQLYPMIAVWDDHESANDSWEGGAQNHQPETEGPWAARKAAAARAYREWMPVSDSDWAQYEIGDLATLFRLETRLTARSRQFDLATVLAGQSSPDAAAAATPGFPRRGIPGSLPPDDRRGSAGLAGRRSRRVPAGGENVAGAGAAGADGRAQHAGLAGAGRGRGCSRLRQGTPAGRGNGVSRRAAAEHGQLGWLSRPPGRACSPRHRRPMPI